MKKLTILLGSCVLALTACAAPVKGTVTDKVYDPEHVTYRSETTYRQQCSGTGSSRSCRQVPSGTRQVRDVDSPDYTLVIETDEGKMVRTDVSQQVYDSVQIGDTYDSENN